jgi:hypothetical protein
MHPVVFLVFVFFSWKKKQVRELQKSGSSQYHPVLEKRCTLVAADPIFPKRSSRRVAKIPIKIILVLHFSDTFPCLHDLLMSQEIDF